jgi:hypothetical protein
MKGSITARFRDKVKKTATCWIWTGAKGTEGYGLFKIDGKNKRAHRVAWELENGPILATLCVCHTCDNPSCVNPKHLFLGTRNDNTQDCIRKGRQKHPVGEDNSAHALTEWQVYQIREAPGSLSRIATLFKVSPTTVGAIKQGKTWKHTL